MWVWVTFAYLIPAVAITMQNLSPRNKSSHPYRNSCGATSRGGH
jgi:hypothetical protein